MCWFLTTIRHFRVRCLVCDKNDCGAGVFIAPRIWVGCVNVCDRSARYGSCGPTENQNILPNWFRCCVPRLSIVNKSDERHIDKTSAYTKYWHIGSTNFIFSLLFFFFFFFFFLSSFFCLHRLWHISTAKPKSHGDERVSELSAYIQ